MNIRLQKLVKDAESRLAASEQVLLADLMDSFVCTHEGPLDFDRAELAYLKKLDKEHFYPADAEAVTRAFQRRG